jgi:hypothetical protein
MKMVSVVQLKRTGYFPLVGLPHANQRAILYGNTDPRAKREAAGTAA